MGNAKRKTSRPAWSAPYTHLYCSIERPGRPLHVMPQLMVHAPCSACLQALNAQQEVLML